MAPICSNCGGTDFLWASELRTGGRLASGPLSLRPAGELALGTRICRTCGHADLFLKDVKILHAPHAWRRNEFVPIVPQSAPPSPQAVFRPRPLAVAAPEAGSPSWTQDTASSAPGSPSTAAAGGVAPLSSASVSSETPLAVSRPENGHNLPARPAYEPEPTVVEPEVSEKAPEPEATALVSESEPAVEPISIPETPGNDPTAEIPLEASPFEPPASEIPAPVEAPAPPVGSGEPEAPAPVARGPDPEACVEPAPVAPPARSTSSSRPRSSARKRSTRASRSK
jgi:hypothetical protein